MTFKELKEMEDYKLADLIDVINEDGEELNINDITDETEIIAWNKSLDSTCIELMVKNHVSRLREAFKVEKGD